MDLKKLTNILDSLEIQDTVYNKRLTPEQVKQLSDINDTTCYYQGKSAVSYMAEEEGMKSYNFYVKYVTHEFFGNPRHEIFYIKKECYVGYDRLNLYAVPKDEVEDLPKELKTKLVRVQEGDYVLGDMQGNFEIYEEPQMLKRLKSLFYILNS